MCSGHNVITALWSGVIIYNNSQHTPRDVPVCLRTKHFSLVYFLPPSLSHPSCVSLTLSFLPLPHPSYSLSPSLSLSFLPLSHPACLSWSFLTLSLILILFLLASIFLSPLSLLRILLCQQFPCWQWRLHFLYVDCLTLAFWWLFLEY